MAAAANTGTAAPPPDRPPRGARPWPALLFGVVLGAVGLGLVGLVLAGPLLLLHRQTLPLELAYGNGAVGLAARLAAGAQSAPPASSGRATSAGRLAFAGSCSVCHGANGTGTGLYGTATYPPATDLTSPDVRAKSDAELFWIIKNGLSFTGMPAFGPQYTDQDLWALVSYLRTLQGRPASVVAGAGGEESGTQANPAGSAVQRGVALYIAEGCQTCHGTPGAASGELALRGGGAEAAQAVRQGRRGMPAYGSAQLSDTELADLEAYLTALGGNAGSSGERGG